MDNSNNNITLEIESTNRERGDSIIRDDIESALDIHIQKNKTLNEEEIKAIDKCNGWYDIYEYPIIIIVSIIAFGLVIGMIYLLGYVLINFIRSLINY